MAMEDPQGTVVSSDSNNRSLSGQPNAGPPENNLLYRSLTEQRESDEKR